MVSELNSLNRLLQRQVSFELIYVFGSFQKDIYAILDGLQKKYTSLRCISDATLTNAIDVLLLEPMRAECEMALLVSADYEFIERLLLRLNERRQQLSAHKRAVFICLPRNAALNTAIAAPDLWSIRSLVINEENH